MWEHIIGHTEQKKFLQNYLQAKERPHALLFSGAAGFGKRTLAGICQGTAVLAA